MKPELKVITPSVISPDRWVDYALIDSGNGLKLERYSPYLFIRPEPQALWRPSKSESEWQADGIFVGSGDENSGHWRFTRKLPESWPMQYRNLSFLARCTPFRHLGLFPEQAVHWDWCETLILKTGRPVRVLNLFAYTGLASLFAAAAGAQVTHIDSSKKAIALARENQKVAGLVDRPIRWICEDAQKFVNREIRRGSHYDGIIIDPPKFGRGLKGEVWKIFADLPELLRLCRRLLTTSPLFFVVTTYAIRLSSLSLHYALEETLHDLGGQIESGEMAIPEQSSGRLLSTAVFSRWSSSVV